MREYMREMHSNMGQWFTPVVKWLFYICIGTFILQLFTADLIVYWFGASPATTLYGLRLWQLFTYMFVHGDALHLVFNLLCLWFFGMQLEERWGSERFFKFVAFVGMCSVLFHLTVATAVGLQVYKVHFSRIITFIIGISGVCYGVMLAFAYYWPDTPIYFWGIFPIKAKILVGIMAVFVLLGSTGSGRAGGGIAHWTHLGGFLFGFLFVKFQDFFDRIPLPRLPGRRRARVREFDPRDRWRNF